MLFGALAFGIGTSEVEHVLATQTLWQRKPKAMGIELKGKLPQGVYAKDIILHLLSKYGVAVGTGYVMEFLRRGHSCYGYGREDDALQYGN